MKILITGGAGFIGSAVIRNIINNTSDSVVNVDCLTYAGNLASLSEIDSDPRYTFEHVNICDSKALVEVFSKHQPDAVMHLAAESHVDRSIEGPAEFIQTNIVGTFSLLEAARGYWDTLPLYRKAAFRFHHISTDEVYGDLGATGLFSENSSYEPSSPYSASKASSDHLVRAWYRTYGLPVIVTNCSNNYGPYQFPEKLIPHIILNALMAKPLPVYGDGKQIRDWLYVEDHARALYQVVTEGLIGETYCIGGHNEKKNIDVVNALCSLLDELVSVSSNEITKHLDSYNDLITFVKDRSGHDVRYAIDATKIQRELDWTPTVTFETGLRETVEWYLRNEDWWRRILDGSYQIS